MADIALINRTGLIRDARFQALLPALQEQVSQHFAPVYGADATLHFVGKHEQPDPTHWKVWLLRTSDQPGDLGYHQDDTGIPEAKIFVLDDIRYGAEISVTISHEILEMLGDPLTTRTVTLAGKVVVVEVCDCVEADLDGPVVQGFRLSNFAYPARFGLVNPAGVDSSQYDYMKLLHAPFPAIRPGGYDLWWDGHQWHTDAARYADGSLSHRAFKPLGRAAIRAAMGAP